MWCRSQRAAWFIQPRVRARLTAETGESNRATVQQCTVQQCNSASPRRASTGTRLDSLGTNTLTDTRQKTGSVGLDLVFRSFALVSSGPCFLCFLFFVTSPSHPQSYAINTFSSSHHHHHSRTDLEPLTSLFAHHSGGHNACFITSNKLARGFFESLTRTKRASIILYFTWHDARLKATRSSFDHHLVARHSTRLSIRCPETRFRRQAKRERVTSEKTFSSSLIDKSAVSRVIQHGSRGTAINIEFVFAALLHLHAHVQLLSLGIEAFF